MPGSGHTTNDLGHRAFFTALGELASGVRDAREKRGWSQEHVAHHAGVSVTTYASLERLENPRGELPNPSLETIVRILWALDLSATLES